MTPGPVPPATGEFILRRIHKNQVDPGPPIVISYLGFRPTPDDMAGLSVYRERLIPAADVAASGRKAGEYYVVRLSMSELESLGLSVVADEQANGPVGHALILDLNFQAVQRDNRRLREVQVRLAELASRSIVHQPES